ncbi:MAG: ABC transporter ATP-binding protein [Chloroflexi bacterium]|nr:ABC transporter ATP-binding protein [Chloroflexota bacterium]
MPRPYIGVSMSRLRVENLQKHFGGIAAVGGVTLDVADGARQAIIGPNGAGKSTLFNIIAGELPPTAGRVLLDDRDITRLPVHARANLGLGHTFQRNNLFMGLSVLENVQLAVQHHHGVAAHAFKPSRAFASVRDDARQMLARVGLGDVSEKHVNELSYGQQRALEVALALAGAPRILLLDEPTAGMSPAETGEMVKLIESLPRTLTMLIVEHDMDVVFSLADRIAVLHYGQVIARGTPAEVRANPVAQEIYLGANSHHA